LAGADIERGNREIVLVGDGEDLFDVHQHTGSTSIIHYKYANGATIAHEVMFSRA
jgi:hypothetical protein